MISRLNQINETALLYGSRGRHHFLLACVSLPMAGTRAGIVTPQRCQAERRALVAPTQGSGSCERTVFSLKPIRVVGVSYVYRSSVVVVLNYLTSSVISDIFQGESGEVKHGEGGGEIKHYQVGRCDCRETRDKGWYLRGKGRCGCTNARSEQEAGGRMHDVGGTKPSAVRALG